MVVLLEVDEDVPYYNDELSRYIDLRSPEVLEATWIKLLDGKVVLDIQCPYTGQNPQVCKDGPQRKAKHLWGYARNTAVTTATRFKPVSRRKRTKVPAAAAAGEEGNDADSEGVGGYKAALCIHSLWGKRFQAFYNAKRKGTEDTYWAIKHA